MFKGLWDGKFALGLMLGVGAVILFILTAQNIENVANSQVQDVSCEAVGDCSQNQERNQEQNPFGYWSGRLFSFEDTAAQWLMTMFSVVASVLLWRTLTATQGIARDTRKIGEAQVRAYLTVDKVVVTVKIDPKGVKWKFAISVRNSGQSPAREVMVWARSPQFNGYVPKPDRVPDLASGGEGEGIVYGFTVTDDLKFDDVDQTTVHFALTVGVEFFDVFEMRDKYALEGELWLGFIPVVDGESIEMKKHGMRVSVNHWAGQGQQE